MPYWGSSSRVGVQPTAAANSKQKKRSERFSRKGITMEDLKKQTALRLAQEQNRQSQKQSGYGIHRNKDNSGDATRTSPPVVPSPSPPAHEQSSPASSSQSSCRETQVQYANVNLQPVSLPSRPAEFLGCQHSSFSNITPTASPSSFSEISNTKQKSKLPHGLTVQELKEMTKARLQAEAASKGQDHGAGKRQPDPIRMVQTPEPRPCSRGMQPSPIPPGFAPRLEPAYMQHELENWEACQFNVPPSYTDPTPFVRPSSFPNAPLDFETRRRAATMSPRLQPYPLHEDRELENFPLRTRAFPPEQHGGRERAFTSYEPREQPGALSTFQPRERAFSSEPGLFPSEHQSAFSAPVSRGRTSSSASMSADDKFDLDVPQESTLRFPSGFGSMREETPSTPGLADVFRVSSFDKSPNLSMDSQENRMRASTWSGEHPHDARMRASTWSEPGSIFGGAIDIADDLASILKLCGGEDKTLY